MARILNEKNEELNEAPHYCPRCGSMNIEPGRMTGPDFDEHGWFYSRGYVCKHVKCGHIFGTKTMILEGTERQVQ